MRVLVCGSRDWRDPAAIIRRLSDLRMNALRAGESLTIVHGDGGRADKTAGAWGARVRLKVEAFPADWRRYGKRAGILRTITMLDTQPDLVLAYQRGDSRGTGFAIDEARRRGIPVEVHTA